MKPRTALLLSVLLVAGIAGTASAQSSGAPAPGSTTSNPETKADNPTDRRNDPAPGWAAPQRSGEPGAAAPGADVKVDTKVDRRDDGAASPRTTVAGNRILGLSPVVLVLLAAALFVIVILAIVSITRDTSSRTGP